MKKKILIGLIVLLLLIQLPFAYRRRRLVQLQKAIQQLDNERAPIQQSEFVDYKGVMHVHSFLGGHSTGTFSELIAAAKANRLDFVIMTEHPAAEFDTGAATLNGSFGGVLFINGNEVVTADRDRLLLIPGTAGNNANSQRTADIVAKQKLAGGLSIAAYPAESQGWRNSSVDGIEIYNLFVNAREASKLSLFMDGLWSYRSFPDLMFANFFSRPADNLKQWDELNSHGNQKLFATGGNDAHSNVGVSINDSTGKQLLGIKLDPYARSFHVVRTHVLIPKDTPLSRESLLQALAQGHSYISFDLFSDATGFAFTAPAAGKISGDEVPFQNDLQLSVRSPLSTRFVLLRNGVDVDQGSGLKASFTIPSGGAAYRIECYLDSLPAPAQGKPWIISNPIFVR